MPNLETYKALMDWAVSPRYRIRGGFNRAFRAPNLGELYIRRTQLFGGRRCDARLVLAEPRRIPARSVRRRRAAAATAPTAQTAQTEAHVPGVDGPSRPTQYYDNRAVTEQPTAWRCRHPDQLRQPELARGAGRHVDDRRRHGHPRGLVAHGRLVPDRDREHDRARRRDTTYQRCMDIAFNPTGNLNNTACRAHREESGQRAAARPWIDRSRTRDDVEFSGVDLALNWNKQMDSGGGLNLNVSANMPLEEITQDRASVLRGSTTPASTVAGCGISARTTTTGCSPPSAMAKGSGTYHCRHQYWPELKNDALPGDPLRARSACVYSSLPCLRSLLADRELYGSDRYTVSAGVENLLDEEPPCIGANPRPRRSRRTAHATGDGSTYDPLGRRFFVSMTWISDRRNPGLRNSETWRRASARRFFLRRKVFPDYAPAGAQAPGNSTCSKSNRPASSSAKMTRRGCPGPECPVSPSRHPLSGSRRRAG